MSQLVPLAVVGGLLTVAAVGVGTGGQPSVPVAGSTFMGGMQAATTMPVAFPQTPAATAAWPGGVAPSPTVVAPPPPMMGGVSPPAWVEQPAAAPVPVAPAPPQQVLPTPMSVAPSTPSFETAPWSPRAGGFAAMAPMGAAPAAPSFETAPWPPAVAPSGLPAPGATAGGWGATSPQPPSFDVAPWPGAGGPSAVAAAPTWQSAAPIGTMGSPWTAPTPAVPPPSFEAPTAPWPGPAAWPGVAPMSPAMQAAPAPQPPVSPADQAMLDAAWGPPAAPLVDPRRFTEAHWQGLELIPKTPQVAMGLNLPPEVPGVIVDDATLPADIQGFQAGDLVTRVAGTPTPDLMAFIQATELVRDQTRANVEIVRGGSASIIQLAALRQRLGTANGETPPMIPPGARMPHPYRGPCTNCHRIGTNGALAMDQGDPAAVTTPPVIRAGSRRPHRDRGPCAACHQIVP